jgi:hypothetical protein
VSKAAATRRVPLGAWVYGACANAASWASLTPSWALRDNLKGWMMLLTGCPEAEMPVVGLIGGLIILAW